MNFLEERIQKDGIVDEMNADTGEIEFRKQ